MISKDKLNLNNNPKHSSSHLQPYHIHSSLSKAENTNSYCFGSLNQYISFQKTKQQSSLLYKYKKQNKNKQRTFISVKDAQSILLDNTQSVKQKIIASKVIAQTIFQEIYGDKIKQFENRQLQKENIKQINLINLNSLEIVMNQVEFNPRSDSIRLRKEQLSKLRNQFMKNTKSKKNIYNKSRFQSTIQVIYGLKNEYPSLKNVIIPTKCQQYEYFLTYYNTPYNNLLPNISSTFFKTQPQYELKNLKQQNELGDKKSEYYQKFKSHKNSTYLTKYYSSCFVQSDKQLIIDNILEMKPPIFLHLMNRCKIATLKIIKFKNIKIQEELLFLFLDFLREMAMENTNIESLQISAIEIKNRSKFIDKMNLFLMASVLKNLRMQSMDLTTNQFNKIYLGLLQSKQLQQIHLQNNRIDILGVKNMQNLTGKLRKLKILDVRNNNIPHYANLKDKSNLIIFF